MDYFPLKSERLDQWHGHCFILMPLYLLAQAKVDDSTKNQSQTLLPMTSRDMGLIDEMTFQSQKF
jgi:hypothetical protein